MTPHSHHRSSRMVAGGGRSGGDFSTSECFFFDTVPMPA